MVETNSIVKHLYSKLKKKKKKAQSETCVKAILTLLQGHRSTSIPF